MHDPFTVAFDIKYPWTRRGSRSQWFPNGYRESLLTIWHKDPERGGNDNSCDWWGTNRPLNVKERAILEAMWRLETLLDNRPHWNEDDALRSREHVVFQDLKEAVRLWRRRGKCRIPVRWHVWHWRLQIHPWEKFKRWAFARCSKCGGRFKWGESACGNWSGTEMWHTRHDGPFAELPQEEGA